MDAEQNKIPQSVAFDGLRVSRSDENDLISLKLLAIVDGEPADVFGSGNSLTLFETQDVSIKSLGIACRLQLLCEAVARFLNTGGDPLDVQRLGFTVAQSMPRIETPDCYLVSSDLAVDDETDETYAVYFEHFYVFAGSNRGFVVAEDRFVDPLTVEEYLMRHGYDRSLTTQVYESNDRTSEVIRAFLEANVQTEESTD